MSNNNEILNEVRSIRNNNPGNLRAADAETQRKLTQPGYVLDKAVGFDKDGFAIFPDKETGLTAMQRQLQIDASRGMTGAQMINKYAPKADNTPLGQKYPNDPDVYVSNVFGNTGIDPNKPIDPKDIGTIQQAMVRQEGGEDAVNHFYGDTGATRVAATPSAPTGSGLAGVIPVVAVGTASTVLTPLRKVLSIFSGSDRTGGGEDSKDPGTLGQYRGLGPTYANSSRSAQSRFQAAAEERAQRQAQREQERRARAERIAQRVAMRKQKMSPTRVAENTIGFKDFRKKIYEQIIMNEEKENQE